MTKFKIAIIAIISFFWIVPANAANYSHIISLSPGWNLISTPRIVENHQFSAPETLSNFSIYLQSSSSTSGWKTMSEMGQSEFTPLYGYFIYNNTGSNQTLTLNYKQSNTPSARMFSRPLSVGWNVLGVANPSYALKQKDSNTLDNNNVINILNSIGISVSNVLDLTATSTNKSSVAVSNSWNQKVFPESNQLDDFRETKAYAVYLNSVNNYDGFQNDDEVVIDSETISTSTVVISKKSTSPSDTTVLKGANSVVVLLANLNSEEAVSVDGLNIKYSSSGNVASTTNQFENVRIYVNGVLLDSFDPATSTDIISKSIDSSFGLNYGDNEIKVVASVKSTATSSSTFKAILDDSIFNNKNPKYSSSDNPVALSRISGAATSSVITVIEPILTATRSDGYSSSKIVVKSTIDISLGKFTVRAANDVIKITSINIASTTNNTISPTNIYDMKLYVDGVQVGSTRDFGTTGANFSSLNISLADNQTKQIELKGSIDEYASGNIQHKISFFAQDSRGTSVTVNDQETVTFVVVDGGLLNTELGVNTPISSTLASKSGVEQEIAQFKFTAVNDDASLTELNIINTAIGTTSIASTTVGNNSADARIAAIKLYDGATLIDSFVPVSGAGKFTITNDNVRVLVDQSKTLSIKVVLNNIDNDAVATNKDIHLGITTLKFKSSNGYETTQSVAKLANNFRVRKTVPTVALLSLPSSVLVAGDQVISKFAITADSNGDVSLNKIVLNTYNSENATITALGVGSALKVNGSYKTVASVSTTTNTMTITFATNEIIAAGTSKTFEIRAGLSVSGSGSEAVTAKISEDSDYAIDGTGNFVWSDGASVSEYTYSNGYRVNGLTTSTQVLSR